jgi:hypothetical protein
VGPSPYNSERQRTSVTRPEKPLTSTRSVATGFLIKPPTVYKGAQATGRPMLLPPRRRTSRSVPPPSQLQSWEEVLQPGFI